MQPHLPEHKGVADLMMTGEDLVQAFKQSSRNGRLMREMIGSIAVDALTIRVRVLKSVLIKPDRVCIL